MKSSEIRELSAEELKIKELDLHQEMMNLRVQAVMGQVENPTRVRYVRRDLARVKTILREKQIASQQKGAQG